MIEVQVTSGGDPEVLAELIASTLHGHLITEPDPSLAQIGRLVREEQFRAEEKRPSREQIDTVNFAKIDDDLDWSEV